MSCSHHHTFHLLFVGRRRRKEEEGKRGRKKKEKGGEERGFSFDLVCQFKEGRNSNLISFNFCILQSESDGSGNSLRRRKKTEGKVRKKNPLK